MSSVVSENKGRDLTVETADGLQIRGEMFGPDDGPPVVLLHGGGQSKSAWRGAARRLGRAGFLSCAMDLRGHGDSDWSPDAAYMFDDYERDLLATIAKLGGPALVVGASMGGHVAMITSARNPEAVRGLAIADITPWVSEERGDDIRNSMRAAASGFASLEEAASMVNNLRGTEPKGDVSSLRRHLREGEDGRFYWRWDPALMSDKALRHGGEGGLLVAEASRLRVPVLLMLAEHSNLTDETQAAKFKALVPGLQWLVIPGAGHMVTGDVNDAYADEILKFASAL